MRQVELSERAKQNAQVMLPYKTDDDIVEMFRLSARITHPRGNRRFKWVLFRVTPVVHGVVTIEDISRV